MKIKVLPQRHRAEGPQLRPQGSDSKARTLGTFGSSQLHSQGLRKLWATLVQLAQAAAAKELLAAGPCRVKCHPKTAQTGIVSP